MHLTHETEQHRRTHPMLAKWCYASKTTGTLIDTIDNATGLTFYYSKTLEKVRQEYPDAEKMTVDAFMEWKAEQQHTPIEWSETTEEQFERMLCVLPPADMGGGGFLVGEPDDHDASTGAPRYQAFREINGRFEVSNRPMTHLEFREQMNHNQKGN